MLGVWGGVFGLQPNPCGPGETYNAQDGLTGFQCMCENPPCGPGGPPEQGGGWMLMNNLKRTSGDVGALRHMMIIVAFIHYKGALALALG